MTYPWLFLTAALTIFAELMFTQLLGLKTWSHLVYVVISTCILGIGAGINLHLLLRRRPLTSDVVLPYGGLLLAVSTVFGAYVLIAIPLPVEPLLASAGALFLVSLVLLGPFIVSGFLIGFLFSSATDDIGRLYAADLAGAAVGCAAYFASLKHGLAIRGLCLAALVVALAVVSTRRGRPAIRAAAGAASLLFALLVALGEPQHYSVRDKGWENIPDTFPPEVVRRVLSEWHTLGRLDGYEFVVPVVAESLYRQFGGVFAIPIRPPLPFVYLSNNFLAGTPAFNYSALRDGRYEFVPFDTPFEFPYVLRDKPRVMIIGVGGGRDVAMAAWHSSTLVAGAEINEATYRALMPGGTLYGYTAGLYRWPGVDIENIDGRQLAKRHRGRGYDLVVLNGVDTFSGLSRGLYAYAESYLYTEDAFRDYLRVLGPDGLLNVNRHFFPHGVTEPRETLRVFVMALHALRSEGVRDPPAHVFIAGGGWGFTVVKRSPFTPAEIGELRRYFGRWSPEMIIAYDPFDVSPDPANRFHAYARAFQAGGEREFLAAYPHDVSSVRDDAPFFYKQYRFKNLVGWAATMLRGRGWAREAPSLPSAPILLVTQLVLLVEAVVLLVALIGLPLVLRGDQGLRLLRMGRRPLMMLTYFASLGLGFMLIEIALIQKFALLLDAAQNALPVVIGALLCGAGLGSYVSDRRAFSARCRPLGVAGAVAVGAWVVAIIWSYPVLTDLLLRFALGWRVVAVIAVLTPLGFLLGLFFPLGLRAAQAWHPLAVSWGWAINISFSVVGTMVSLMLSQFLGFDFTLRLAAGLYALIGALLLTSQVP